MQSRTRLLAVITVLYGAHTAINAQQFEVAGRTVQVHGFLSQGFAYSNENNFLTVKTSEGSFAFTDFGFNFSSNITDKFRVGAQLYDRNIGQLGNWHPHLDWAVADYKFKDWFGVRTGKVKTAMGLYNDTQDAEVLHTWAILPQSVYPLDLRSRNIAHTGADVYGEIPLHRTGSLGYTVYAGTRPHDTQDGYSYASASNGYPITEFKGWIAGVDLRWNTPVKGLMVGASYAPVGEKTTERDNWFGGALTHFNTTTKWIAATYGEYALGRWRFAGEYRRNFERDDLIEEGAISKIWAGDKGWFVSAACRVTKSLELGTYHSRYYVDSPSYSDPSTNHIFDQALTVRVDLNRFWSVKVEGHFMDGTGDMWSSHGFYAIDNAAGLRPRTNLLVIRTGLNL